NASFISALALAFLPIALLMPRRLTLPIQAILIAIALAPMFVEWPTSVTFSLAVHLSLIAVTCRGCQDVAVRDLPPPDLRLEFAVCALAGYFIAVVGVDVLPPLLFPDWSPEYPIALVTALLVRLIHWRASHRLDPTFEPKLDDRITAVSPS
ncbi:MAG TPA: hypothetical protein VHR72_14645, partial [Gemmataceae bacterium]|nr:hypothetical protein [Gemmataceae bacterium]